MERQNFAQVVEKYYSGDFAEVWEKILGPAMHYHHGFYPDQSSSFETAMETVVRNFYPNLPEGSKVLDAGCGWGGPALQLQIERNCNVFGVCNSESQVAYARGRGLNVVYGNLESMRFSEHFDAIIMIESLDHIVDKLALFRKFRQISKALILRVNCVRNPNLINQLVFGGSSCLVTPEILLLQLKAACWEVHNLTHRRAESKQTFVDWLTRIEEAIPQQNRLGFGQISDLFQYSNAALANWDQFEYETPLVDIIAY